MGVGSPTPGYKPGANKVPVLWTGLLRTKPLCPGSSGPVWFIDFYCIHFFYYFKIMSFFIPLVISLASVSGTTSPIDYVETRIGTDHAVTHTAGMFGKGTEELGQTLPAVLEPHGMNFWTPQTRDTERKCVAPYYYSDNRLMGFRNSHWIVGGCTQDYGSMTLMPLGTTLRTDPQERASRFSHDTEVATPAYYAVDLDDEGLKAEMTGRSRSAIFRFTYGYDGEGHIVVNHNSDENQGFIAVDPDARMIYGYNPVHRIYQGWGEPAGFAGYFVVMLDRRPSEWGTDGKAAWVKFDVHPGEEVQARAASSFVSMRGALANLEAEIPHWDFDRTRAELEEIWNARLGQVKAEGGGDAEKTKFYSALYRTNFLPRTFNDVDGSYPSFGGGKEICHTADGRNYYEDYSMWDTYRAQHPLIVLLHPVQAGEMMQSLVDKYEQGGWLPIFPCWNSYTSAMIGDHCIAAIADAYVKGVRNFDIDKAYEGMRKNAFESPENYNDYANGMGRRALPSYLKYGYVPLEDSVLEAFHKREQVSRTLEYAFDDYALAQVAKQLGYTDDYRMLSARSLNYKNVIDPSTGYARGRHADGSWEEHFNPVAFDKSITEGAPCHYTWYVPHDQEGLMEAMGGREAYEARLDSMFSHRRYWHGNEPCHQVAWLYNYIGSPKKTQKALRHIIDTEYLPVPGGLSGNDDAGQMSAWLVFASMGLYPVCPASGEYALGSPVFENVEIALENGKTFIIKALNASPENIYVESVRLNGRPLDKYFISHEEIMNGGVLEFVMCK